MICRNCGRQVPDGHRYCEHCGAELYPGNGFAAYDDMAYETGETQEGSSRGNLMAVLIGAGIGVLIVVLVFGIVFFVKESRDEPNDRMSPTSQTSSQTADSYDDAEVEYDGGVDAEEDYSDYDGDDYDREAAPYAAYADYELYDPDTPEFFPESEWSYLTGNDVLGLSEDQRQKAINDIYARNGYIFSTDECRRYYEAQPGYYGLYKDMDEVRARMNDYEQANVELLSNY